VDDVRDFIKLLRRPLNKLPDPLPMTPIPGPFTVSIRPSGSKSLTNRALILGGLSNGVTYLRWPLLDADDAQVMVEGLRRMGAQIRVVRKDSDGELLRIDGVSGRPRGAGELNLGGAGTAVRFLTAAAGLSDGETVIDGSDRMRHRPIAGLVAAMRAMKVRVDFLNEYGFPPIRISVAEDGGRLAGGTLHLPPQASSQFISALLMVAPWTREGISIELDKPPISKPYVHMTLELLKRLGATNVIASADLRELLVAPGPLQAFDLNIEPDASGATYFWAAAANHPGSSCRILGITQDSLQGDAAFPKLLDRMGASSHVDEDGATVTAPIDGALHSVDADLSDMPDAAMTLAAVACFAIGKTRMKGLGTLPIKECNRLAATVTELRKCSVLIEATADSLSIESPKDGMGDEPIVFSTYHDHRMAMALAVVGLRRPNVSIADPVCVAKTYPTFWRDLSMLYEAAIEP